MRKYEASRRVKAELTKTKKPFEGLKPQQILEIVKERERLKLETGDYAFTEVVGPQSIKSLVLIKRKK